jgi:hypothetical protein
MEKRMAYLMERHKCKFFKNIKQIILNLSYDFILEF